MRTSKKAMDLFIRDLQVAIETKLRDYRNQQYDPSASGLVKGHLGGLENAKRLARAAMKRTQPESIPECFREFTELVSREALARVIQNEARHETVSDRPFTEPKSPNDIAIYEEVLRMFHECALDGSMPEPRMTPDLDRIPPGWRPGVVGEGSDSNAE